MRYSSFNSDIATSDRSSKERLDELSLFFHHRGADRSRWKHHYSSLQILKVRRQFLVHAENPTEAPPLFFLLIFILRDCIN